MDTTIHFNITVQVQMKGL